MGYGGWQLKADSNPMKLFFISFISFSKVLQTENMWIPKVLWLLLYTANKNVSSVSFTLCVICGKNQQ